MVISAFMKISLPRLSLAALLLCRAMLASAEPLDDDPLSVFLQTHPGLQTQGQNVAYVPQGSAAQVHTMSDVVVTALGYLDKPYTYGGQSMEGGFDCSGFVLSLFQRALGLKLPRTAAEQAGATHRIQASELVPGDLVFFNTTRRQYSHVGIYVGDGRFIHSPRAGARIRIESMHTSYWKKRFNGAHRVPLTG